MHGSKSGSSKPEKGPKAEQADKAEKAEKAGAGAVPAGGGSVTITRVGGMLPTLRPAVTLAIDELDGPAGEALRALLAGAGRAGAAPHPDSTGYVFKFLPGAGGGSPVEVSTGFSAIPEVLRSLLPGPR